MRNWIIGTRVGKRFVWWAKRHRLCKTQPVNESGSACRWPIRSQSRFPLNSMKNDCQLAAMIDSKRSVLFALFSPSDSWAGQVAPLDCVPHPSTHRHSLSFVTIRCKRSVKRLSDDRCLTNCPFVSILIFKIPRTSDRTRYGRDTFTLKWIAWRRRFLEFWNLYKSYNKGSAFKWMLKQIDPIIRLGETIFQVGCILWRSTLLKVFVIKIN